jgi:hypothetical protein
MQLCGGGKVLLELWRCMGHTQEDMIHSCSRNSVILATASTTLVRGSQRSLYMASTWTGYAPIQAVDFECFFFIVSVAVRIGYARHDFTIHIELTIMT